MSVGDRRYWSIVETRSVEIESGVENALQPMCGVVCKALSRTEILKRGYGGVRHW